MSAHVRHSYGKHSERNVLRSEEFEEQFAGAMSYNRDLEQFVEKAHEDLTPLRVLELFKRTRPHRHRRPIHCLAHTAYMRVRVCVRVYV